MSCFSPHTGQVFSLLVLFPFFLTFWWIVCLRGHCMEFPPISSMTLPCWSFLKALTYSLLWIKRVIGQCHFIFNKLARSMSIGSLESLLLNNQVFQFHLSWRCSGSFTKIMHIISGVSKELCLLSTLIVWYLIRKLIHFWNAAASPGCNLLPVWWQRGMWIFILLLKQCYSILVTVVSSIIYEMLDHFLWLSSDVFDESS